MKLKEIEIVNFRQHQYKKISLTGNLIGVIGPNGSGKSNLLAAFQFALSGDVPGINKEKLLRWGADTGYIQLSLIHSDGTECRIKRDITSSSAEFDFGDQKFKGTTNVNAKIKELLEYDKELGRQSIFVQQTELDSVLFETASKREQAFQKLCGLGEANTLYKDLGDLLLKKFTDPPNYDEQLAQANIKLNELELQQVALNKKLGELDKVVISEEDITKMQLQITESKVLEGKIQALKDLILSLDNVKKLVIAWNVSLTKLNTQMENTGSLEEIDINIEGAYKLLADAEKYTKAVQAFEAKQTEYNKLGNAPCTDEELEVLTKHVNTLRTAYQEAQGSLKMLNGLLNAIGSNKGSVKDNRCPLCGNAIRDITVLITKLQTQIVEYQKVQDPSSILQDRQLKEVLLNGYKIKQNTLESQIKLLKEARDSIEAVDVNIEELNQAIATLTTTRQRIIKGQVEKVRLTTELNNTKAMVVKLENDINECSAAINQKHVELFNTTIKTDSVDLNALQIQIQAHNRKLISCVDSNSEINTVRASAQGQLTEVNKFISSLKQTITDLEHKRASQGAFKDATKVLNNVRDWFNYKNGPRIVSSMLIKEMTGDINLFLERFEAPFRVTPKQDEGLAFSLVFIDGRETGEIIPEADDLSGGQKILLATSFRLAGYCLFANKLGLISLDEPTVYLDDKNIERFCSFLEKVKEVANQMNLQILMATHERSLIPYMDCVIDLGTEEIK